MSTSYWVSEEPTDPDELEESRPAPAAGRNMTVMTVAVVIIAIVVVSGAWYLIGHEITCASWRADIVERSHSLSYATRTDASVERDLDPYGCR